MKPAKVRGISAASSTLLYTGVLIAAITLLLPKDISAETNGARRCHWCGPRAEQVHRSRRATDCDLTSLHNQVTECDSGYDYCAIVATMPPYTESRYCVKLYQDECYPLYCNTTGTWKITCPCRGDLCNGINTEREINAFSALTKLTAKNIATRKKATKTHSNIMKRDVDNVLNDSLSTTSQTQIQDSDSENNIPETKTPSKKICRIEDGTSTEKVTTPENINSEIKNDVTTPTIVDDSSNEIDCEYDKELSDEQKTNHVPLATKESPSPETEATTPDNKIINKEENPVTMPPAIIETKITEPLQVENQISEAQSSIINQGSSDAIKEITMTEAKPSLSMPTAESLQQNVTPITTTYVEKLTELTTETTTSTTTMQHEISTTLPHENTACRFLNNNVIFIIISLGIFINEIFNN